MKAFKFLAVALPAMAVAACTVHKADAPPALTGPSGPAQTIDMRATPDTITQDGQSVSTIAVTMQRLGQPVANQEIRFDMTVNGIATDFGTFRPGRTARTDANGLATVSFTAPPASPPGRVQTCEGLPGICVDIVATPTGSDFQLADHPQVRIRLAPPSVIQPPADPAAPIASFVIATNPVKVGDQAIFNASSSTATAGRTITSYAWDFGDGTRKSGVSTAHDFDDVGVFIVTLTVTDNFGLQGVFQSPITVVSSSSTSSAPRP